MDKYDPDASIRSVSYSHQNLETKTIAIMKCRVCSKPVIPGKVYCWKHVHGAKMIERGLAWFSTLVAIPLLPLFLIVSTIQAQDVTVKYHEAFHPENSGMEVIIRTPIGNDTLFYFEETLTSFSDNSLKLRLDLEASPYLRIKAATEDGLHLQWNNVHYKITRRWYKDTRYYFLHSEVLDTTYVSTTMSAMVRLAQERADNHYNRTVINR